MDDGFGVAARSVAVPFRLKPSSQFSMVVNLAVENDPDVMIFVGQGLVAGFHINNAKPPHGQPDVLFDKETLVIGPAMHDAAVHARQHVSLDVPVAIGKKDSADSTHRSVFFFPGQLARQLRTAVRPGLPPSFTVDHNRLWIGGDYFKLISFFDDLAPQDGSLGGHY